MKLKAILLVSIIVIVIVIVIFLLLKKHSTKGDNKYKINNNGSIVKDRNGIINSQFKKNLENPKYDPTFPGTSYYKYASAKNHQTNKYFISGL